MEKEKGQWLAIQNSILLVFRLLMSFALSIQLSIPGTILFCMNPIKLHYVQPVIEMVLDTKCGLLKKIKQHQKEVLY